MSSFVSEFINLVTKNPRNVTKSVQRLVEKCQTGVYSRHPASLQVVARLQVETNPRRQLVRCAVMILCHTLSQMRFAISALNDLKQRSDTPLDSSCAFLLPPLSAFLSDVTRFHGLRFAVRGTISKKLRVKFCRWLTEFFPQSSFISFLTSALVVAFPHFDPLDHDQACSKLRRLASFWREVYPDGEPFPEIPEDRATESDFSDEEEEEEEEEEEDEESEDDSLAFTAGVAVSGDLSAPSTNPDGPDPEPSLDLAETRIPEIEEPSSAPPDYRPLLHSIASGSLSQKHAMTQLAESPHPSSIILQHLEERETRLFLCQATDESFDRLSSFFRSASAKGYFAQLGLEGVLRSVLNDCIGGVGDESESESEWRWNVSRGKRKRCLGLFTRLVFPLLLGSSSSSSAVKIILLASELFLADPMTPPAFVASFLSSIVQSETNINAVVELLRETKVTIESFVADEAKRSKAIRVLEQKIQSPEILALLCPSIVEEEEEVEEEGEVMTLSSEDALGKLGEIDLADPSRESRIRELVAEFPGTYTFVFALIEILSERATTLRNLTDLEEIDELVQSLRGEEGVEGEELSLAMLKLRSKHLFDCYRSSLDSEPQS